MPAPLSIVIPTYNAARFLPETTARLFEGLRSNLIRELVICDGGSVDAVTEVTDRLGGVFVRSSQGRGFQLSKGAETARGEWLLFLHADTHLQEGWSAEALDHMEDFPNMAGCFKLQFRATGICSAWFAAWANFRTRRFFLPYGDQGLLISKALYEEIGGYPHIELMEDVVIAQRLGRRIRMLNSIAETSARKQLSRGWIRCGIEHLITFLLFRLGVAPDKLARNYYLRG